MCHESHRVTVKKKKISKAKYLCKYLIDSELSILVPTVDSSRSTAQFIFQFSVYLLVFVTFYFLLMFKDNSWKCAEITPMLIHVSPVEK